MVDQFRLHPLLHPADTPSDPSPASEQPSAETQPLDGTQAATKQRVSVFREAHFNAAHRLHRPDWSPERNEAVFGLCNNPNWHGHNYKLVVRVTGTIDPETGYVIDLKVLKDIIAEQVTDRYDHKNLNEDLPEFAQLNPTAENIAVMAWQRLRKGLDAAGHSGLGLYLRLYETPRNFVEFPAAK